MKKIIAFLLLLTLWTIPASAMTYDSATDTWTDADGNIISEDDLPPTDLSEYSHSFFIHKTYTAGDVVLAINNITIGGTDQGYLIDVDYHVWVDTEDVKKYALYGISDGVLSVDGSDYPLQYQSMSAWDETYNHSGMADYRSGQDKFLQSFSLTGEAIPELFNNTPMELRMMLNDRTNGVSTEVVVRINEQLINVSDGKHTVVFCLIIAQAKRYSIRQRSLILQMLLRVLAVPVVWRTSPRGAMWSCTMMSLGSIRGYISWEKLSKERIRSSC